MTEDIESIVTQSYNSNPKYTEIKAGLPEDYKDIKTLRDLLAINYKLVGAKEQLRRNLISLIETGGSKYPGIIGFDDDVLPALDRAILSKHDIFIIGLIGQAKTKLVQTIAENLLSPIPIVQHSITNDCPLDLPKNELALMLDGKDTHIQSPKFHISPESAEEIRNNKLDTPIEWLAGKDRYKYVLATPDISVKDLVGYIDAVKVAKKGIEMYKIDSYSPGQLMQAKHGIFCIDELPVLDPRKQVALLSVLQEGRFTTGSYPIIFEPKIAFFATANPIDYTHSAKVIEPLYDRLKSHIHTHYPKTIESEMMIILQEANISKSLILSPLLKTLAKVVQKTRDSTQINQEKGVSVRLGIHGLELLVGEAERTRALSKKILSVPRISDMHCLDQIIKFELSELDDTIKNREKVFDEFLKESIKETCLEYLEGIDNELLESIKYEFLEKTFQVSQNLIWKNGQTSYSNQLENFSNLKNLIESKLDIIQSSQNTLKKQVDHFKINSKNVELTDLQENELRSTLLEIILEGLCWTNPKILDKNEAGYVSV
ncbi:MAG: AAA family ATPase [Thaumarchaeota archaeon]|nr:AAA family ATPase [Nitrososphaerota archaeon]